MDSRRTTAVLAGLIGVGIVAIGTRFLVDPAGGSDGFGVPDAEAYLAVKGVRDIGSGLVVLTLLAAREHRAVGWTMLAFSVCPAGDLLVVLTHGGSPAVAFGVHGSTALVMVVLARAILRRRPPVIAAHRTMARV